MPEKLVPDMKDIQRMGNLNIRTAVLIKGSINPLFIN